MQGIRSNSNEKASYDLFIIIVYLLMVCCGWLAIYSVDYNPEDSSIFSLKQNYGKQLLWIGASLMIGFVILLLDPKIPPAVSYFFYITIVVLLAFVFTLGKATNGALSWIEIGSFKLQPSEFAKLATSLCLARFLDTYNVSFKNPRHRVISFLIFLIPMGMVLMQNDTGSAMVFAAFLLVLYREGLPLWIILFIIVTGVLFLLSIAIEWIYIIEAILIITAITAIIVRKISNLFLLVIGIGLFLSAMVYSFDYFVNEVLKPYQRERIYVTLGMIEDNRGKGYNVYQSKVAIGSGGVTGKGYMEGTQTRLKFVPEQNTDFIFCTIGEEGGFIGSAITVLLFLGLLWRIIIIAERQKSRFNRIYAYCVACVFFMHFAINIGMTMGLFPVIGIPLPFYSYGGSSMLSFSIMLFVLIRLDANRVNEIARTIDD